MAEVMGKINVFHFLSFKKWIFMSLKLAFRIPLDKLI